MKINKIFSVAVALTAIFLSACNEDPQGTTPKFPSETQTFTVSPNDTIKVTFTANDTWQLSSDAMWCRVDGLFLDTSGKAGEQNIAFVINADGHSVNESKANITLRMGNESRVIAIVTRIGITNAIIVGCDTVNYKHNQTVTIGTSGIQELVIRQSTFDINNLYITQNAEWFNIERTDTVITLSVKAEYLKYSQHNGTDSICFSDKETPMMRLNIQYTGMDAQSVILEPSSQWALRVATDGLTYKESLYETIYEAPIQTTVSVLDDAYTLYRATYNKGEGCTLVSSDSVLWFTVSDDQLGHVAINFNENTDSERTGYVFVLPNGISDTLTTLAEVSAYLFDDATGLFEVKAECEQYLIAQFVQESAFSDALSIIHGTELYDVEFTQETDSQWFNQAINLNTPSNQIFHTQLEFGVMYKINPKFSTEAWNPSIVNGGRIEIRKIDGSIVEAKENIGTEENPKVITNYRAEPALTEDDLNYYIQLQVVVEEDYIIYFIDDKGNYLKALAVENILE